MPRATVSLSATTIWLRNWADVKLLPWLILRHLAILAADFEQGSDPYDPRQYKSTNNFISGHSESIGHARNS